MPKKNEKNIVKTGEAAIRIFNAVMDSNPNYVSIPKLYKNLGSTAAILHATSIIIDKLFVIAQNKRLKKIHWLSMVYLATTPVASNYEIRAYLKQFHGYNFGQGNGVHLNLRPVFYHGLAEKIVIEGFNRGKPVIRLTDKGRELVGSVVDKSIVRSMRDYLVWRNNRISKPLQKRKQRIINEKYPELKYWAKF